ncbi:hypothetical protein SDC9_199506 [bioreactor metagenome]|uniref:Uncharacterized protein n=1 Tax=bioreactor metagenome TaxID=1076179 RepID=A0A645ILE9_9ZZZZ
MGYLAVDAAVGQKTQKMEGLFFVFSFLAGLVKHRISIKVAFPDRLVNSGQLLVNNAAGAYVEVTYLRIAHLALRQAHIFAAG